MTVTDPSRELDRHVHQALIAEANHAPRALRHRGADGVGAQAGTMHGVRRACVSFEINPRAYLHVVTKHILNGWPMARLRELLPDQIVRLHPELAVVPRAEAE